jgi:Flp pilus assembly protein TadB
MVTAQVIACWAYCPEQWRLQYGLGLEPENRAAMEAGDRRQARKAAAKRIVGGSIMSGRFLAVLAVVVLFLLWVLFPMMATPGVAAVAVLALLLGLVLVLAGWGRGGPSRSTG